MLHDGNKCKNYHMNNNMFLRKVTKKKMEQIFLIHFYDLTAAF